MVALWSLVACEVCNVLFGLPVIVLSCKLWPASISCTKVLKCNERSAEQLVVLSGASKRMAVSGVCLISGARQEGFGSFFFS